MANDTQEKGGGCREVITKGVIVGGALTTFALINLYSRLPAEVQLAFTTISCLIPVAFASVPAVKIYKEYSKELEAFYNAFPDQRPEAIRRAREEEHQQWVKNLDHSIAYEGHKRALRKTFFPTRPTIIDAYYVMFNPNSPRAEKARANYVINVETSKLKN
ncbi:MAG: hypothetical protein WCT22_02780 [Patescibacteria group bacterium]|jgi:hypothetical protein